MPPPTPPHHSAYAATVARKRTSLRSQVTLAGCVFALVVAALAAFSVFQFSALSRLSDEVNTAGRLRMLSQHAALLTHQAARADKDARPLLESTQQEFDRLVLGLRKNSPFSLDAPGSQALAQLDLQWLAQTKLSNQLVAQNRALSEDEALQLAQRAHATLDAAEYNVAMYIPKAQQAQKYLTVVVSISVLFGALVAVVAHQFLHRRVLQPLRALDALLDRLGEGDLSARASVSQNDEIGRLTTHLNTTAEALEANIQTHSTTLEALRDSETRNRTLWEISHDAIVIINTANTITFANPAVLRTFGYAPEELVGQDIAMLQPEHLREVHRAGMARYLAKGTKTLNWAQIDTQTLHKDGHAVDVELSFGDMQLSNDRLLVGTFRDVTARKLQQEALIKSANFDVLTGLPNRVLLHDRIEQAIANARRHNGSFGLLYLDLDNFKIINDTLGHESGDLLLCEAASRLQTCVRDGDTVARVGGDEFVLLLSEMHARNDIDLVAQRALAVLGKTFFLGGSEGFVGVSIGASVFPEDAHSRVDLMQHADIAMYRAKEMGRNNYQRYAEQMQSRFKWRMSMEVQLRAAIENSELVMHYQPQIDLASGRVVGAEALIRWESPTLGRISPAQFIPLAEETGLIVPIGAWVIQRSCSDAAQWLQTPYGKGCAVAINLSPRQFSEPDLLSTIQNAIADTELGAQHFEFEVTESLVMQDPDKAAELLKQIRALGCTVALDDFGTGYSSLASLRSLPLDVLKIDKSLIHDVAIVRAVIQMARSFGFKTLAEGVEDDAVLYVLRSLECDMVQGYFYARPMPLHEFLAFLQTHGTEQAGGEKQPSVWSTLAR